MIGRAISLFLRQGMKLAKCLEISAMWDYCKKQKKKVGLLGILDGAARSTPIAGIIQDAG